MAKVRTPKERGHQNNPGKKKEQDDGKRGVKREKDGVISFCDEGITSRCRIGGSATEKGKDLEKGRAGRRNTEPEKGETRDRTGRGLVDI